MATRIVRSSVGSNGRRWRERAGVLALGGAILTAIGAYLALSALGRSDNSGNLLPYQTLARTLPESDQRSVREIRQALLEAESERARTAAWPEAEVLASRGVVPFSPSADSGGYYWSRLQQGAIVNYFGHPQEPSQPSWLLEIQEPEPGMLPDPAPNDEEHHRLPDGTMLHVYVWMHRYGGQVPVGFVRQPQNSGWIEVFSQPPNPVFYNRR
jgi:hypothetical protein